MTAWNREICPVCRRLISVNPGSGAIRPHTDKAGRPCPMSGQAVA